MATAPLIMMTPNSHRMKLSGGGPRDTQSNSNGSSSSHSSAWKKRIKMPMRKMFRRSLSSREVDDDQAVQTNNGSGNPDSPRKLSRKKNVGFAGSLRRSFSAGQLVGLSSSSTSRRSKGKNRRSSKGLASGTSESDSDGGSTSSNSNDKSEEESNRDYRERQNRNRKGDLFEQYQIRLRSCVMQQEQQQRQWHQRQQQKRSSSSSSNVIKAIRFNENVIVQEIPHIRDMSTDELTSVWMKGDEFNSIRSSCRTMVNNVDSGELPPEGFALLRGLDQHMKNYKERRDEIHSQVHEAVFRLQRFQTLSGVNMSEEISKACIKYSEPALIAAHMAAISDLFTAFKDTWTQRHIPTVTANPKPIPGAATSIINDYHNPTPSLGGLNRRTQSLRPRPSAPTNGSGPRRSMSSETPKPTPKLQDALTSSSTHSAHSTKKRLILLTPNSATMNGATKLSPMTSPLSPTSSSSSICSSVGSESDDDDDDYSCSSSDDDSSVTSLILGEDDDLLCLVPPEGLPVAQPTIQITELE